MCGRFSQFDILERLADGFGIKTGEIVFRPNYNVTPGSVVWTIDPSAEDVHHGPRYRLVPRQWGIVPAWAKNRGGRPLINARMETAAEKPTFRSSYRRRRCIVPANGYYEWTGEKGRKQPWYVTSRDASLLLLAALWMPVDSNGRAEGQVVIMTRTAGESLRFIHHRMPVVVEPKAIDAWMHPPHEHAGETAVDPAISDGSGLDAYRVGTRVNSGAVNSPACVLPLAPTPGTGA